MYGCQSWTIKKAEHWRTEAFELWCWRRLLRVPWTAGRSNQSILKEISTEYSLEGLMLKLKPPDVRNWLILMLGKIEGRRRRDNRRWDGWMESLSMDMSLRKLLEIVKDRQIMCAAFHGVTYSQSWLSHWTTIIHLNSWSLLMQICFADNFLPLILVCL